MIITCPSCSWSKDVPGDKIPAEGAQCTCPKCNSQFTVKNELAPVFTINNNPPAPTPNTTKPCPLCGEEILAIAKKCKHCGETLDIVLRTAEEARRASKNPNVYMNAGGGAAASAPNPITKQNFPHGWHFLGAIFTGGLWAIMWILMYVGRDKNRYY